MRRATVYNSLVVADVESFTGEEAGEFKTVGQKS